MRQFITSLEVQRVAPSPAMKPTRAAFPLGLVASKVTEKGQPVDDPVITSPEKPFSFQKACRGAETA